ncbi:MAG TPA: DUF6519 domain-containing protein [Stellaceae bacterium]|nr:DUF6519 domain-containing protein [Stellaceae bacterium]
MRGDFSRYRFDPAKNYTAVLEQQGRVQLDADANEQRAIDALRLVTETIDVIGTTGAPINAAGFVISLRSDNNSLLIGPGRYYVNGLLCEMLAQTDYTQQTFLIGPQPGVDVMLADLRAGRASAIQVWLEAWQRMVTPIDDPCIRDPALGEADTTVRVQTVWRVVAEEVAPITTGQTAVAQAVQGLRQSIALYQQTTRSTALESVATQADTLAALVAAGNISDVRIASSLTALHTVASATVSRLTQLPAGIGAQLSVSVNAISLLNSAYLQGDCCAAMSLSPVQLMAGEMTVGTGDASNLGPCLPSPQAAYRGLENQLYRIELHQGGALGAARFKWSRDNGSVLTRITNVSGKVLTVDSLGPDANLGFAPLQWVEISDDSDEFGQTPNQPGQLHQIQTVDFEHNQITLTETAPAVDTENGHAKLRRWDQTDANATSAGVPMAAQGDWNSLENGIQVQFSDARPFQPGDFWLVPARTATGEVEWPPCGSDGASFQPARNTTVYRAPLACIDWEPNAGGFVPYDCRNSFYPLTELTPPPTEAALHVTAINWANDDVQTLDQLFAGGLNVTLDGAPVTSIDPARYIVSLEYPISIDQFSNAASAFVPSVASGLLRSGVIVDGAVSVTGNIITWSLPQNLYFYLAQGLESFDGFANQQQYIRARVLLKGRMIWGSGAGATPFLDGQCFGVAGTRSDGQTPRTDLMMPSGAAAKASDFESWFYLAPLPRVTSLAAAPPAVAWVPIPGIRIIITRLELVDAANPTVMAVPVLNLSLNYYAIADTQVMITVTGGTPGIVTVQSPVTIPRGAVSPAQPIPLSVRNTGQATTETYTLTAAVILSSGVQFPVQTTFSVTGHTTLIPPPPVIGEPISPILPSATISGGGASIPSDETR